MSEQRKARILPPMVGPVTLREFVAIVMIGGVLLLLACGMLHLATRSSRDQDGARKQQGRGTVTGVGLTPGASSGIRLAYLELDDRLVTLDLWDAGSALGLKVGQKVVYTYLVGRSGTWYINEISPAPAAESTRKHQ